jgi:hypothetical protein
MRVKVLHVRQFDFLDSVTQKPVTGCKAVYLDGSPPVSEADQKGTEPQSISGPVGLFRQFGDVPGVYDIEFSVRNGKARLVSAVWVPPAQPSAK